MEIFQSEIKKQLLKTYRFRLEIHAHTMPVSLCGHVRPEQAIEMYKELGYDLVVVTNHFNLDTFGKLKKEEAIEYYWKDYEDAKRRGEKIGVAVLPSTEIRFEENMNDYLLYGVDKDILRKTYDYLDRGLAAYRSEVKLPKSVFLQAHPLRDNMTKMDSSLLDGIESFNMHLKANSRIGKATRYAAEEGMKIVTCGSDFHGPELEYAGVGGIRTKTLPQDSFELAAILKSGDYVFEVGGNAIVLP